MANRYTLYGLHEREEHGVEVFVVVVEDSGRGASELLLSELSCKTISFSCFTSLAIVASQRSLWARDQFQHNRNQQ